MTYYYKNPPINPPIIFVYKAMTYIVGPVSWYIPLRPEVVTKFSQRVTSLASLYMGEDSLGRQCEYSILLLGLYFKKCISKNKSMCYLI